MARIVLDSKSVPDWFRVKVLAATAPVGGSVLRYWFEDRRHWAEIVVPGIRGNMLARTADCPECQGFGVVGPDSDTRFCQPCDGSGRVERLEIVGRTPDGSEFVARLEGEPDTADAGGDALGLLVPELTEGAKWHA